MYRLPIFSGQEEKSTNFRYPPQTSSLGIREGIVDEAIDTLFSALNQDYSCGIHLLEDIPPRFQSEMSQLFRFPLFGPIFRQEFHCIGILFIQNSSFIQKRANLYIRLLMSRAESLIFSMSCASTVQFEADCANFAMMSDWTNYKQKQLRKLELHLSDFDEYPEVGRLLLSNFIKRERLADIGYTSSMRYFMPDEETKRMYEVFLRPLQTYRGSEKGIRFNELEFERRMELAELKSFFGSDYVRDDLITVGDMNTGFQNCALNFIARDSACKECIKDYLSTRIAYCLSTLFASHPSPSPSRKVEEREPSITSSQRTEQQVLASPSKAQVENFVDNRNSSKLSFLDGRTAGDHCGSSKHMNTTIESIGATDTNTLGVDYLSRDMNRMTLAAESNQQQSKRSVDDRSHAATVEACNTIDTNATTPVPASSRQNEEAQVGAAAVINDRIQTFSVASEFKRGDACFVKDNNGRCEPVSFHRYSKTVPGFAYIIDSEGKQFVDCNSLSMKRLEQSDAIEHKANSAVMVDQQRKLESESRSQGDGYSPSLTASSSRADSKPIPASTHRTLSLSAKAAEQAAHQSIESNAVRRCPNPTLRSRSAPRTRPSPPSSSTALSSTHTTNLAPPSSYRHNLRDSYQDSSSSSSSSSVHSSIAAAGISNSVENVARFQSNQANGGIAITPDEVLVLQTLLRKGEGKFTLSDTVSTIRPISSEYIDISFKVSGTKHTFCFERIDFGILFDQFLDTKSFSGLTRAEQVAFSRCSREMHRCFFLHVGVALNLHPFALQCLFRIAAADILSRPEEDAAILFGECLCDRSEIPFGKPGILNRSGVFVDATALIAVWPIEFDETRITVCKFDHCGNIEHLTIFEPDSGPRGDNHEWQGKDILLENQFGHFTLLKSSRTGSIAQVIALGRLYSAEYYTTEPILYEIKVAAIPNERRYSMKRLLPFLSNS